MRAYPLGPAILDIEGTELTDVDKDILRHPRLGGLILFSRNYESIEQLSALVLQAREVRPNLLISVDHEGGRVQRFREGFSSIPAMASLGDIYEENAKRGLEYAEKVAWLLSYELVSLGVDHSYAPVLDLDKDRSEVIGDRAFSDMPNQATALAEAFISGMNQAGMKATAKHFPGHGSVVADSHLALPVDNRTLEQISAHDMIPFVELKERYSAVMTAHISFPEIDPAPVSFSRKWIKDILKKEVGYQGLVLSDDLSMKGAGDTLAYTERVENAVSAGCDAVLICNNRPEAERALEYIEQHNIGSSGCLDALRADASKLHKSDAEQHCKAKDFVERYL